MKAAIIAGCVMLPLAIGAAHARTVRPSTSTIRYMNYLPPVEYDKPFTGTVIIRRLETEEEIERHCKGSSKLACAGHTADGKTCYLTIVNDNVLRSHHIPWAFVLRHEIGHCNGWTQKHENKRKVQMIDVGMPTLTKDLWVLPAYPPVVCVTPDWKPEPCKNRNAPAVVAEPSSKYQIPKVKPGVPE
jgi:hypothetical protein